MSLKVYVHVFSWTSSFFYWVIIIQIFLILYDLFFVTFWLTNSMHIDLNFVGSGALAVQIFVSFSIILRSSSDFRLRNWKLWRLFKWVYRVLFRKTNLPAFHSSNKSVNNRLCCSLDMLLLHWSSSFHSSSLLDCGWCVSIFEYFSN